MEEGVLDKTTAKETPDGSKARALSVAALAEEKHAGNVTVIYIGALSSVADYIVVCDGSSDRQVKATADFIIDEMKGLDVRPIGVEGMETARWVLIDYGDVVVHVFHGPVREQYDIEGLWADAPRVLVEGEGDSAEKAGV